MDPDMLDQRELRAIKMQAAEAAAREAAGPSRLAERQEELADALNSLGVRIEQLESRLQPVLRDPEPTQALHATPGNGPDSPLGAFLTGAAGHARELTGRLQELIARVDL